MALQDYVTSLPGWEFILFIIIFGLFLVVGFVVTFKILSNLRWPFSYVVLEDVAGRGFVISRRGKCRVISFGDGGEEVFLLKHIKKYRIAYGKRIGPKQIGWAIDQSGDWYNFSFGDLNKKLMELGVMPSSIDVKMSMASLRKGIDKQFLDKSGWEKYGPAIMFGTLILSLLIFAGMNWYMSNKNVEIAQINAENSKVSKEAIDSSILVQQKSNEILDRLASTIGLGGSGIIIEGGGTNG